jgi:hypothetical protein
VTQTPGRRHEPLSPQEAASGRSARLEPLMQSSDPAKCPNIEARHAKRLIRCRILRQRNHALPAQASTLQASESRSASPQS